ncbi:MAG: hypothetical protein KIIPBIDF_01309 [Candidatus Methanoperedenaceae archaeon GB50]|nr:MAG: hypothetical protein KIIPBIDF_01309 [Candidatus Methanoperedenaceae archaeon GB50]
MENLVISREAIIKLLQSIPSDQLLQIINEVLSQKKEILSYWSDEEIKNIGKIGLSSKTFLLDNEDYSKW